MDKYYIFTFRNQLFDKRQTIELKDINIEYYNDLIEFKSKLKKENETKNIIKAFPKLDCKFYSYIKVMKKENIEVYEVIDRIFNYLTCVRLENSYYFDIHSKFYVNGNLKIFSNSIGIYNLIPIYKTVKKIDENKIKKINELYFKFMTVDKLQRLKHAYVMFAQSSLGWTSSMQLNYMALFSALEALYKPSFIDEDSNNQDTLINRCGGFLSKFSFNVDLKQWLSDQYSKGRCELFHGGYDVPWKNNNNEKIKTYEILYEIVRLTILEYIKLDKNLLLLHSSNKLKEVRKFFNIILDKK